jgi:hypothetical protein
MKYLSLLILNVSENYNLHFALYIISLLKCRSLFKRKERRKRIRIRIIETEQKQYWWGDLIIIRNGAKTISLQTLYTGTKKY